MPKTLLDETLAYLVAKPEVRVRRIAKLHLSTYFSVVELDDGCVGSCMSYYHVPSRDLAKIERSLMRKVRGDPLLRSYLSQTDRLNDNLKSYNAEQYLIATSLKATIVSALSAPFLKKGGKQSFLVTDQPPADWIGETRRALLIGFGGFLPRLAESKKVCELHVADMLYGSRRRELDEAIARLRILYPNKRITISSGKDVAQRLKHTDLAVITGSTLCNGSLDPILAMARSHCRIVLQGQSASIHPIILFERGVEFVCTTIKPRALVAHIKGDFVGKTLIPYLENGLPWIYLSPRM